MLDKKLFLLPFVRALGCTLGLLLIVSCKTRKFHQPSIVNNQSSLGKMQIGVNDVAYLLKPTTRASVPRNLLRLNTGMFIADADFKVILNTILESGTAFAEQTRGAMQQNADMRAIAAASLSPFMKPELWSIVGFRVEFCQGTPELKEKALSSFQSLKDFDTQSQEFRMLINKCEAQVRIIAQPESDLANQQIGLRDFALHLFYKIEKSEIASLLSSVKNLSQQLAASSESRSQKNLGIHPIFSKDEAYTSDDQLNLSKILETFAKFAKSERLIEVETLATFGEKGFTVGFPETLWLFAHFEKDNAGASLLRIESIPISRVLIQGFQPRNGQGRQSFIEMDKDLKLAKKEPRPALNGGDSAAPFAEFVLTTSWFANNNAVNWQSIPTETEPAFDSALREIERIENPRRHNLKSADCVSCHIAMPLRENANRVLAKNIGGAYDYTGFVKDPSPDRYVLQNDTISSARSPDERGFFPSDKTDSWALRQFGFVGRKPYISQRVINDAAEGALIANLMMQANQQP